MNGIELTSFDILFNELLHATLVCCGKVLNLQAGALGAEAAAVHGLLQGVALPPKNIVGVLAVRGSR